MRHRSHQRGFRLKDSVKHRREEIGVSKFIFSSTAATFGEPQYIPIVEKHPQQPINPYGRTKLMIEQALADYDRAYGLKSVCLRYFNAAGADPEGQLGERHDPETHLILLMLQASSGRRPHISVFGRDYDTPDGTCIRDYIHIADLCEANWLAVQSLLRGADSQAYNLGNGQGFSVQEVIDTACAVTGKHIAVVDAPRREGDPARLVADANWAKRQLVWVPHYADLATIIQHAWAFEQGRAGGYQRRQAECHAAHPLTLHNANSCFLGDVHVRRLISRPCKIHFKPAPNTDLSFAVDCDPRFWPISQTFPPNPMPATGTTKGPDLS